jgi:hypothetical protein
MLRVIHRKSYPQVYLAVDKYGPIAARSRHTMPCPRPVSPLIGLIVRACCTAATEQYYFFFFFFFLQKDLATNGEIHPGH